MTICLIFRKKNPTFFSIENVFGAVEPWLRKKAEINKYNLPLYTSGISAIWKNIRAVRGLKADLFHVTGDVHYAVLALPRRKTILTIHDTVFMYKTTGLKRLFFQWIFLRLPVKRTAYITTISEKSKQEIMTFTGCKPGKIVVIPNPVGQHIYHSPKDFNKSYPVILFVGTTPNKNLSRAIEALKNIPCKLEIIGKVPEDQVRLLQENGIDWKNYQHLSDAELAQRYAHCDLVLFPSLYEGFGLPVIESQKAGRAVITSNISPMKDVCGQGACLVDPQNTIAIRNAVTRIIEDDSYRNELIANGFENVRHFEPEVISARYLQLYESLFSER